jgi:energy-converting hydrogenase Eha subunit A
MLKTIGILTISGVIVILQLPKLVKKKMIKESWLFSSLMLLATATALGNAHDLPIPNPLDLIGFVMEPLSKLLSAIFD